MYKATRTQNSGVNLKPFCLSSPWLENKMQLGLKGWGAADEAGGPGRARPGGPGTVLRSLDSHVQSSEP